MVILASIPSLSVLTVATKSATSGFIHGFFTTIGIVLGDIIFILLTIYGLSIVEETMGSLFFLIKYLGGIYLIWLGIGLWKSKIKNVSSETEKVIECSLFSSFITGLLITLADQKATLFYLGFLPAFLDISQISYSDTIIVIITTIFAVGGVKIAYAFTADKARFFMSYSLRKRTNFIGGCVMIFVGLFLLIRK